MVAGAIDGMIRVEQTLRRGLQVSPIPESTLTDPQQIIADLRRELAEMALRFARKNRWAYPYESAEQALAAMEFSDLSSFIVIARVNSQTMRTIDDYCDLARQYLGDYALDKIARYGLTGGQNGHLGLV